MEPPDDLDLDSILELEAELESTQPESPQPEEIENNNNTTNSNLSKTTEKGLFKQVTAESYLPDLNLNQREAVAWKLEGGLQILAGPGSGKTKVLTTRVAYLLQNHDISPEEMVVVTFTNKAANEMKTRLSTLIGGAIVEKLIMGTFHSVCVRFLRKYGKLLGLASNFIIADRNDCLAIIKRASSLQPNFSSFQQELKPNFVSDVISKCKSNNHSAMDYLKAGTEAGAEGKERRQILYEIYLEYERNLKSDNALDFDDLLLYGLNLVQRFPHIVSKVKTVLIDEFQDTNTTQYELVKAISKASKSLTIVGDPDQSIYGWRNASSENLDKMLLDYKGTKQIFLEENYRSTGAILGAALAVVRQDSKRINKSLLPTHPAGSSCVLHKAPSGPEEASFIVSQIKHLVAYSGGLLDYGDFAILLRYGALSRVIEVALQKGGVPSRMVGGNKFFERAEVKDILSYLQLVDNPSYSTAVLRMINVPKRSIGAQTIKAMIEAAKLNKLTIFEVCVKAANGSGMAGVLSMNQRKGVRQFVEAVRDLRTRAEEGASVPDLIDHLMTSIDYLAHLERTYQGGNDSKERYENILELKAYAVTVAEENPDGIEVTEDDDEVQGKATDKMDEDGRDDSGFGEEMGMEDIVMSSSQIDGTTTNPLRTFLAVSMLATDTESESTKDEGSVRKVTLSTCHSAKGLEWPVVFVPACEAGVYPFYRSTKESEIDEERRLLYVAITRAKVFCTMSYAESRMLGAETKAKVISPFLKSVSVKYPTLFVPTLQKITPLTRIEIAKVLNRPKVMTEMEVSQRVAQHLSSLPPDPPPYKKGNALNRYGSGSGSFNNGSSGSGSWNNNRPPSMPASIPSGSGFSSALNTYKSNPLPIASTSKLPPPVVSSSKVVPNPSQPQLSFAAPKRFVVPSSSLIIKSTPTPSSDIVPAALIVPALLPTKVAPFKKPTMNPVAPATLSDKSSTSKSSGKGSLKMPETRQSKIDEPVLLNPVYKEPVDLLESFKKAEVESLKVMKGEGIAAPSSDVEIVVPSTGRPKRGAAKRAAEGFPKKNVGGKKRKGL